MKSPKQPAPTSEEIALRKRQTEDLARLDDEENRRIKGLVRGRLGAGSLLSGRRSGGSGGSGGGAAAPATASTSGRGSSSLMVAGLRAAMRA